jgi:hypothetical protein
MEETLSSFDNEPQAEVDGTDGTSIMTHLLFQGANLSSDSTSQLVLPGGSTREPTSYNGSRNSVDPFSDVNHNTYSSPDPYKPRSVRTPCHPVNQRHDPRAQSTSGQAVKHSNVVPPTHQSAQRSNETLDVTPTPPAKPVTPKLTIPTPTPVVQREYMTSATSEMSAMVSFLETK